MTFSSRPVGGGSTSIHVNCHDLDINMILHAMTTIGETKVRGPPVRVAHSTCMGVTLVALGLAPGGGWVGGRGGVGYLKMDPF